MSSGHLPWLKGIFSIIYNESSTCAAFILSLVRANLAWLSAHRPMSLGHLHEPVSVSFPRAVIPSAILQYGLKAY